MRAVIVTEPGGADALEVVERATPEARDGEVLVEVVAAGVNRADVLQRLGGYPPPEGASDVLGLEMAGRVAALGTGVSGWSIGDAVCAVLASGGYATHAVAAADCLLPWPPGLDGTQAAAVPEVFTTAYDNLITRARLQPGETVLIHGGSSGVGTAATQLAVRHGCRVLVTAGSAAKLEACAALGADAGIDYRQEDFVERVKTLTDGRGVDVVLDHIGGDYLQRNLRCLATEGRLAIIGAMGGAEAELPIGRMLGKRLTVTASTLRARSVAEKAALADQLREHVWPGFADGSLRPVIDRTFALDEVADAHRRMESSEHIGKLVLEIGG